MPEAVGMVQVLEATITADTLMSEFLLKAATALRTEIDALPTEPDIDMTNLIGIAGSLELQAEALDTSIEKMTQALVIAHTAEFLGITL